MIRTPKRKVLELGVGLGLLLSVVLTVAAAQRGKVAAQVRADTIRLHVLANSDTIEDQLLKLEVRDAILDALPTAVTAAATPRQAAQALRTALPLAVLAGAAYNVCVYFAAEPGLLGQAPALYQNVSRLVQFWL